MNWINFYISGRKPRDGSWVLIQTTWIRPTPPRYEVCYFKDNEWYIPANDNDYEDENITNWAYIQED